MFFAFNSFSLNRGRNSNARDPTVVASVAQEPTFLTEKLLKNKQSCHEMPFCKSAKLLSASTINLETSA